MRSDNDESWQLIALKSLVMNFSNYTEKNINLFLYDKWLSHVKFILYDVKIRKIRFKKSLSFL